VMRVGAWASQRPDAVVVNSTQGRDAHEAFGYRPRRWVVIPNGVDTSEFAPQAAARARVRTSLALGADDVLVGMFGRMDPMKEQPLFAQALTPILAAHPRVHAVGVGRHLQRVLTFPAHLSSRVHLPGEQADVASWMNACDIVVSTSSSEGFPNVIAEAMSCARPCVVTPSGMVTELVGSAGVVLEGPRVEGLRDAITGLVLDAAERDRLGAAARSRIVAEFSIDRMVAHYETLYWRDADAIISGARSEAV
jgi:glycosyltransferase involved in cell wall biosynthesis